MEHSMPGDPLVEKLINALNRTAPDRHKLILVLGSFGTGKTQLLQAASAHTKGAYLDLTLTERLRHLPRSRYNDGVTVHSEIDKLCDELSQHGRPLFADNFELLFSPELGKVNPVDTFKRISRQRSVVLALPARCDRLLRQFNEYLREATTGQKLTDVRKEAIFTGFEEAYRAKRYQDIITVGDKLNQSLIDSSTEIFDFIDIAGAKLG
jgi:hypothetical protein